MIVINAIIMETGIITNVGDFGIESYGVIVKVIFGVFFKIVLLA